MTTSEQQPPVNNDQPEFAAQLKKHFKIIHQPLSNNYLLNNDILLGGS